MRQSVDVNFDRDLLEDGNGGQRGGFRLSRLLLKSGELVFKLGAWKDKLEVSFEILLLPLELPVTAPKREVRGSASDREFGHRDMVKLSGHDLLVFVFVGE